MHSNHGRRNQLSCRVESRRKKKKEKKLVKNWAKRCDHFSPHLSIKLSVNLVFVSRNGFVFTLCILCGVATAYGTVRVNFTQLRRVFALYIQLKKECKKKNYFISHANGFCVASPLGKFIKLIPILTNCLPQPQRQPMWLNQLVFNSCLRIRSRARARPLPFAHILKINRCVRC